MADEPGRRVPAAAPRRPIAPVVQESTPSLIANRVREAIAEGLIAPAPSWARPSWPASWA
jgi:hypothetical protein